jgi:hypothetical protein
LFRDRATPDKFLFQQTLTRTQLSAWQQDAHCLLVLSVVEKQEEHDHLIGILFDNHDMADTVAQSIQEASGLKRVSHWAVLSD